MRISTASEFLQDGTHRERFWDLVIVGSGPVGLTLAAELNGSGQRILILESGGLRRSESADDLGQFENVGAPRKTTPELLRARVFGGTSAIWSGRCSPFDEIDFEERSWVPFSGWPQDVLDRHASDLERASVHLGLDRVPYDSRLWSELRREGPKFNAARLRSHFWQYSYDRAQPSEYMRFGPQFLKRVAPDIEILLDATVIGINTGGDTRALTSLEVAAVDGRRTEIRAKRAVLCAGGIENARLLQNLRGAGGERLASPALAGRFLMDHPRCTVGQFAAEDGPGVARFFGLHRISRSPLARAFTHGVALSTAMQRSEGLLNCAAWVTEARSDDDPWDALRRMRLEGVPRAADVLTVTGNLPSLAKGFGRQVLRRRGVLHRCTALNLDCLVEQVPDPESKVDLAERQDRFGVPLARIDWRISALETRTVARFATLIANELQRLGGPPLRLASWIEQPDAFEPPMLDAAHPIGTTRISSRPRNGVVDKACEVHGIKNLFIAGSSVFPTAGHANPTLMALMMTVRLADHLKALIRRIAAEPILVDREGLQGSPMPEIALPVSSSIINGGPRQPELDTSELTGALRERAANNPSDGADGVGRLDRGEQWQA